MYTAIFVDDEEFIRNYFIKLVKWNTLNFDLIGNFSDGESALEFIKNNHVDLAILDIKLPGISGIELCRFISEFSPYTSIIFLSAYENFSYAVEGIKYGVTSYLTKPILTSELTQELEKVKEHLDELNYKQNILLINVTNKFLNGICYTHTEKYTTTIDLENMFYSLLRIKFFENTPSESEFINHLFNSLSGISTPILHIYKHDVSVYEILVFSPTEFSISIYESQKKLQTNFSCSIEEIMNFYNIENIEKKINTKKENIQSSTHIINSVKDYIAEHYNEDISLKKAANIVYITPNYLSTLFKNETGMNFSDFLTKYRINKACELLKNSKYTIQDVCRLIGYSDINHFYKLFKKTVGCSPNKYRNNT